MGISAVLYFFCFPQKFGPVEMELSPLAFFCLVPLTLGAISIRGTLRGAGLAMIAGWAAMLAGMYWIIWITPLGSLLLTWHFAWYWIIFYGIIRWTKRRMPFLPLAVSVPLVWVSLEFVRAFMLTGFPWLYLAHSQYRVLPLIQISDVTGAYGVSVLIAAVNGLLADGIIVWRLRNRETGAKPPWRPVLVTAGVVVSLTVAVLAHGWSRLASERIVDGPKIAAVQGLIPQNLRRKAQHANDPNIQKGGPAELVTIETIFADHLDLTREAMAKHRNDPPDLIAWPESTHMVEGGMNAYDRPRMQMYMGHDALRYETMELENRLRDEAWFHYEGVVREALGRKLGPGEELILRGKAWQSMRQFVGTDNIDEGKRRAWAMFNEWFKAKKPERTIRNAIDKKKSLRQVAWLWFQGRRLGKYGKMVKPLADLAKAYGSTMLIGGIGYTDETERVWDRVDGRRVERILAFHRRRNAAFLIRPDGSIQSEFYIKQHLVPFGEYLPFKKDIPWLYDLILSYSPVKGPDGKPRDHSSLPGEKNVIFSLPAKGARAACRFASPICFEITIPRVCRRFVRDPLREEKQCDFLVNISNDGWFEGTSEHYQHLASAVFRAVENRVGIVRSVNTGVSGFISPTGETYGMLPPQTTGVSVRRIRLDTDKRATFYTRNGDVFAWTVSLLAILLFLTNAALALRTKRTAAARE